MDGDNGRTLAIDGQGLYFFFDRNKKVPVLNEANIAVPRGAIYSLLGPSGCGKTTLLKCIIGQYKIQGGSLRVYGRVPGSKGFPIPGRGVGYMPQELGLYFEMSILEILSYFGSLYAMNKQLVKERIHFLINLLALPEKKRMIKQLSGGQQRRVSFAIALLHKPPLLILDEPTVGVDPLLRQTIWDHLVTLTRKEHMTIIITTHYTEEARQADTVGLMRNGQLLMERNPEDLITEYGVTTLEEVFLKLCQNQSAEDRDHETAATLTSVESHNPTNGEVLKDKGQNEEYTDEKQLGRNRRDIMLIKMDPVKRDGAKDGKNSRQDDATTLLLSSSLPKEFDYGGVRSELSASFLRLICLIKKSFLHMKRNIFLMTFSILIPTIQMAIFCVALGSDPFDLNVSVVNLDEDINKYGEYFLNSVSNRTVRREIYGDIAEAYESVKRGESWAALRIGPDFSACLVDRILEGSQASNDTLRCSMVDLHLDNSNKIIAAKIYFDILEGYMKAAKELLEKFQRSTLLAESPVNVADFVYGSNSSTVFEFMAPALLVAVAYIISIGLTVISLLEEKKLGLFERTFVAGATHFEVLMALFSVLMLIASLGIVGMLVCTFFVFGIPCNGSPVWVVISILLAGTGGIAYGFFISTVTDDLSTAIVVAVGSFFPTIILSGVFWPVESMPHYLRYFIYSLPLTKLIESVRSIVAKGWGFSDYNVWEGYLICSSWTIAFTFVSFMLFKYKK